MIRGWTARAAFAGPNEGEGIPGTTREQLLVQLALSLDPQHLRNAVCQLAKCRVRSHTAEPIAGVTIVGLASVHDPMHKRSVRRLDRLCDRMRRVQMVVPQKHQRPDEFL